MRIIATEADIAEGLAALVAADPRLVSVVATAGDIPLRRTAPGFAGLARVVIGQQVSTRSAEAIWARFAAAFPDGAPDTFAASDEATLRGIGLSGAKIATLRAVASADGLDLAALAEVPAGDAHARLTTIRGIGPWTADIYLLFCLGHPDVFPTGDLALRHAVADTLGRNGPIPIPELTAIATRWSPWRAVAARLFWSYYRARRNAAGAPL